MKKFILLAMVIGLFVTAINWAVSDSSDTERERRAKLDTRVDNNKYWIEMAEQGLTVLNPVVDVPKATFTGSTINTAMVATVNSPDVAVSSNSTQSENSIIVDPNNYQTSLNSNNSGGPSGTPIYGSNDLYSFDGGETYDGENTGAGGNNSGDPAACIGTDGRWYVGYIKNSGQGVAHSDDQGQTWTHVQVAPNPGSLADKNHLWLDRKVGSPYENYLYDAWTDFGGSADNKIVLKYSADRGETWSAKKVISTAVYAGSHSQGVNVHTGPNGEVYAVWGIYDGWPQDEKALGFAKSYDGGETWTDAVRIIDNIRGIRNSAVPQNMRVATFPVMAVDISSGSNEGNIYVVWTNIGIPGVNTGNDRDIYMIKSEDEGETWSDPIRVNQDPIGQGKAHYMPWITCDPSNGTLSVVFYDNRNTNPNQAEAWAATSNTAGETWEDFKVSDVSFTPSPIPGLASGYFGDYLGITALDGLVYPCWTDNRSGNAMTYVSVFETIDVVAPFALTAATDQETGECVLDWSFSGTNGFENFNIYRNQELIATTTDENYTDQLTEYGYYTYEVTAMYTGNTESGAASDDTQYGTATIELSPLAYTAVLYPGEMEVQQMKIKNIGVLDLDFSLSPFFGKQAQHAYEEARGGGDEFIHAIKVADLSNHSASDYYSDFTSLHASLRSGQSYPIEVQAKNPYQGDQVKLWMDWNNNGVFDEDAVQLSDHESFGLFKGSLDVPKGAHQGIIRMRVRLAGPGSCEAYGHTEYGEVEDYSIVIADWLTLDPDEGIVAPGDSLIVDVTFDSDGMATGSYSDVVNFITNDLNNSTYAVDFTLHITDMQLAVSADPSEICLGETTTLQTQTSGGSGSYTYSWTSIPEGFTSEEQNPVVNPEENTQYIVSVNDGIASLNGAVDVVVHELPTVALGDDQILCGETSFPLDAGNPGSTYLWSTGEVSQTIVAGGSGESIFWVDVTNENACMSRDSITIVFAENPVVELHPDTAICHNASISLDAGNPGASYLWSTDETTQTINIMAEDYEYGVHTFSVAVSNEYNCMSTDEVEIEILDCTSIDEWASRLNLSIYPNPSTGVFNISFDSAPGTEVGLRIVSIKGAVVYEETDIRVAGSYNKQLDLNHIAEGVYGVFVSYQDKVVTRKIVITK